MSATLPTTKPRTAEEALERVGWSGERFLAMARKIANDYARTVPYLSMERREELASFLVEKGLAATMRFDPSRPTALYGANGGSHFDSWIADILWKRCVDWLRTKAEGNGDSRYSAQNRIVLTGGDVIEDAPDDGDPELELERLMSERRLAQWQEAARLCELPLSEFVTISVDRAARAIRASA